MSLQGVKFGLAVLPKLSIRCVNTKQICVDPTGLAASGLYWAGCSLELLEPLRKPNNLLALLSSNRHLGARDFLMLPLVF